MRNTTTHMIRTYTLRLLLLLLLLLLSHANPCLAFSATPSSPSFLMHVDQTQPLTPPHGINTPPAAYCPMVSVPCQIIQSHNNNFDQSPVTSIIKPPNVEALYDWYVNQANTPNADPSWAVVWPTAVALTQHLLLNPQLVHNQTVVELGAGLGLVGLVAAAACHAKSVTLTDREPWALQCAMATAACHSNWQQRVNGALLDWTRINQTNLAGQADVICASDVLYDGDTIQALAQACQALAAPTGATLLLADPQTERLPGARDMLRQALTTQGSFQIHELPPIVAPPASTMDGRDHVQRMQEPVVLIQCDL